MKNSRSHLRRLRRTHAQAWVLSFGLATFLGCGSTMKTVHHTGPSALQGRWVMLPIANYAETPQAGERVQALLETVLRKKGIETIAQSPPLKEDDTHLVLSERQRYEESFGWAREQRYDYAISGSVEEWRYKGGLDGEPAVGLTVTILEVATNRVLWSGSGTRTGSGGENVSGAALRVLGSLVDELKFK